MANTKHQEMILKFLSEKQYEKNLAFNTKYYCFYLYDNGYYVHLDNFQFKKIIYSYLVNNFTNNITSTTISNFIEQVSYMTANSFDDEIDDYIALKDCLYNCATGETSPFDINKFITYQIPFTYEEIQKTEIPNFTKFLNSSLVLEDNTNQADHNLIQLVKEMLGYFFLSENVAASFFLVGEGSNGKSKLSDIIRNIFGNNQFCTSMSIERLTTRPFSLPSLIGKKLNITHEEESKYMRSDTFKALVSGDYVHAEYKGGIDFDFKPKTKFLFASNKLPTFDYINKGLRRRINIIPFHRIFERHDPDYDDNIGKKMMTELPGIIRWGFDGALDLIKNNYNFTKSEASEEAMAEFESEISSALRFIRENYVASEFGSILVKDLYIKYRQWCDEVGKKPLNKYNFAKDLKYVNGVKRTRVGKNKDRGINLCPISENDDEDIDFNS